MSDSKLFLGRFSKPRPWVFILGIIFTFHTVVTVYLNSSYIEEVLGASWVNPTFIISALVSIVALGLAAPRLLSRLGSYQTATWIIIIDAIALLLLAFNISPVLTFLGFVGRYVGSVMLSYLLDILLEHYSHDASTGSTRGLFLSLNNIAWVLAPLTGGLLTDLGSFGYAYLLGFLLLMIFALIFYTRFAGYQDDEYERPHMLSLLHNLWPRRDLRFTLFGYGLLSLFYAWMVVYTPLYLYNVVGFGFGAIGGILAIMLSAFLIFEYPLGKLADYRMGEKEIMTAGFIIMGVATFALSFISIKSFALWAFLLFITRAGAAASEVTLESYFFKHVESSNTAEISLFRILRPLGYVIAPLLSAIFLFWFDMQYIFSLIGVVTATGIFFSTQITDTK